MFNDILKVVFSSWEIDLTPILGVMKVCHVRMVQALIYIFAVVQTAVMLGPYSLE